MPKTISTPIEIILYDENDEEKKRYTRLIVRWGILKRAMALIKSIDMTKPEEMTEADLDAVAGLVCEAFSNQFTVQDLDDGADLGDMMAVIEQIVNKARGIVPNPPPAS